MWQICTCTSYTWYLLCFTSWRHKCYCKIYFQRRAFTRKFMAIPVWQPKHWQSKDSCSLKWTRQLQIRTFYIIPLGITSYYCHFVANYSAISAPLTDLTNKNAPNKVSWTPCCEQAFNTLKEQLCSESLLKSPDFEHPFIPQTDASEQGVSPVVSQQMEDGQDNQWHTGVKKKLLPENNDAPQSKKNA